MYISRERGSTKLASGKINYYIYVPQSEIISQIYTEIYVRVKDADKLDTFSDEYEDKVKKSEIRYRKYCKRAYRIRI